MKNRYENKSGGDKIVRLKGFDIRLTPWTRADIIKTPVNKLTGLVVRFTRIKPD